MTIAANRWRLLWAVAGCVLVPALACSQGLISGKPVRLLVPSSPGGPSDFVARMIAPGLSEALGRNVVVDSRSSVSGIIAADLTAKATPDGSTLAIGNNGTHAINPSLYPKLPYDPVRDFAPVSQLVSSSMVLVASPRVAANSIKEFVAAAKKDPGKLNIAVAGAAGEIAGEALKASTQIKLTNVRYKGSSPSEIAVLSGEVDVTLLTVAASHANINAGKLKALGLTGARRSSLLPNVPTIAESGVEGYEYEIWHGLFAPAGVPDRIVRALHTEVVRIVQSPLIKDRLISQGFEIVANTPEQFTAFIKREIERYRKVVAEAGIKVE
jgi:tripartite-type tricarboxylate transporter receptor subunit TctC